MTFMLKPPMGVLIDSQNHETSVMLLVKLEAITEKYYWSQSLQEVTVEVEVGDCKVRRTSGGMFSSLSQSCGGH